MATPVRTFLVECYLPGIEQAAVAEAGARARDAADGLRAAGADVTYVGAMLVAADEVVFHAFTASDAGIVEEASRNAGLAFERIVESIGITGADDAFLPAAATADRPSAGLE